MANGIKLSRDQITNLIDGSKRGSLDDLRKLASWADDWSTPQTRYFSLFCHHLNPSKIPPLPVLTSSNLHVVQLASTSLAGVVATVRAIHDLPEDNSFLKAVTDSWTDIWLWVHFLHSLFFEKSTSRNVRQIQSNVLQAGMVLIYESYFSTFLLLASLAKREEFREQLASTPGFFEMVTTTWVGDLRESILTNIPPQAAHVLCRFAEKSQWVNKIISCAGGDPRDVAKVAIEHVKNMGLKDPDYDAFVSDMLLITGFSIVHDALNIAFVEEHSIIAMGMSLAVLTAHPYSAVTSRDITRCLQACFYYLDMAMDAGLPVVLASTEFLLIQGILLSDPWMTEEYPASLATKMLQEILPGYLAYRSVLSFVGRAMKKVRSNDLETRLRKGGYIWKAWSRFKRVALERLKFKDGWDAEKFRRPCSSSECLNVGNEGIYMRCAGCKEAFYCSAACQKVDWKKGNHREICKTIQAHRKEVPLAMANRDLEFLGDLTKHEIYKQQGYVREHNPPNSPNDELKVIYVDFNLLSKSESSVIVGPSSDLRPLDYQENKETRTIWDKLVDQARRSRGRLTLVLVGVAQGTSRHEYYALASFPGLFESSLAHGEPPILAQEGLGDLKLAELQLTLWRGIHQRQRRAERQLQSALILG